MGDSCVPAIHFTQAAAWGRPCYERFLAFRELGGGLILDYALFPSNLIIFYLIIANFNNWHFFFLLLS